MYFDPAPNTFYNTKSDAELWRMAAGGDSGAFALIFDRYNGILFKFGLTLAGDRELVKDSIQDFFIYLWDRRTNISEVHNLRAYLLTSFRRFVLQTAAKHRKHVELFEELEPSSPARQYPAENPDEQTGQAETGRIMQAEIEKLPKRLQEIVFLKFYQGLSYEEITAVTGLNYQVVRNTVYRAVKQLRSAMSDRKSEK